MKYVLSDMAGENYRMADGLWCDSLDHAERFSHDAAKVRQEELLMEGVHTKVVETSGRKRKLTAAMAERVAANLDKLEQAWIGKTIGIGYDIDVEVGRFTITLEPDGEPENALQLSVDVANICIGQGEEN
jgi:hypothetical protein